MTMLKVRLNNMKKGRLVMIKTLSRKHRSRIESAVSGCQLSRDKPDFVRDLETERLCLRIEIALITTAEQNNQNSKSSVLIANKLRRIDSITKQLNNRKLHA